MNDRIQPKLKPLTHNIRQAIVQPLLIGTLSFSLLTHQSALAEAEQISPYGYIPLYFDMDGDGDLDRYSKHAYGDIIRYQENYMPFASIAPRYSTITSFDLGLNPAPQTELMPTAGYLDEDNLLDWVIGQPDGRMLYYENTDPENPLQPVANPAHPINQLSVSSRAIPTLVDLDSDGDLDLVVGTGEGTIQAFQNVGSRQQPQFASLPDAENPFAEIALSQAVFPSFGDQDDDGDLDLVASTTMYDPSDPTSRPYRYYENVGTPHLPHFVERSAEQDPLRDDDYTRYAYDSSKDEILYESKDIYVSFEPSLAFMTVILRDVDQDGDLDVIRIGRREETNKAIPGQIDISAYHQMLLNNQFSRTKAHPVRASLLEGSYETPQTIQLSCEDNCASILYSINDSPFQVYTDSVTIYPSAVLKFYAVYPDGSQSAVDAKRYYSRKNQNPTYGQIRLYYGDDDGDGVLGYYRHGYQNGMHEMHYVVPPSRTGTQFIIPLNIPSLKVDFLGNTQGFPAIGHLNDNAALDWVIGLADGRLLYYENTDADNPLQPVRNSVHPINQLRVSSHAVPAMADIDRDGDLDLIVGTGAGTLQVFSNLDNGQQFVELTGTANPLATIKLPSHAIPSLGDLDMDNDLDLVVSSLQGLPRYYENTGTASPAFAERTGADNPLPLNLTKPEHEKLYTLGMLVQTDYDNDADFYLSRPPSGADITINPGRRPAGGSLTDEYAYTTPQMLTLACNDECEAVYYALNDGPFQVYTDPLTLTASVDVKLYAAYADGGYSAIITYQYVIEQPDDICRIQLVPDEDTVVVYTLTTEITREQSEAVFRGNLEFNPTNQDLLNFGDGNLKLVSPLTYQRIKTLDIFGHYQHISVNPATGMLWGWKKPYALDDEYGLYQIDLATEQTTPILVLPTDLLTPIRFTAMTWDTQGAFFYLLEYTESGQNVLWQYSAVQDTRQVICDTSLENRMIGALEALSADRLMYLETRDSNIYAGLLSLPTADAPVCQFEELGQVATIKPYVETDDLWHYAEQQDLTFSAEACAKHF